MKTILKLNALPNGAVDNQTGSFSAVPEGWAEVPEALLPAWNEYKPFALLTVEGGAITGLADNAEARAAQMAADAEAGTAAQIAEYKRRLAETDYCVIKIAEGAATVEEYTDVIAERQTWRAAINELEGDGG